MELPIRFLELLSDLDKKEMGSKRKKKMRKWT